MVATSGDRLLDDGAVEVVRRELIPLAVLITPNSEEAAVLIGNKVGTVAEATHAAELLVREHGAVAALVKGGHLTQGDEIVDVLFIDKPIFFRAARIESRSTHGTGCTLSAAITAAIALGAPLEEAVGAGISFVRNAIVAAPNLGRGSGPLGHSAQLPAGFPRDDRNSVTND